MVEASPVHFRLLSGTPGICTLVARSTPRGDERTSPGQVGVGEVWQHRSQFGSTKAR